MDLLTPPAAPVDFTGLVTFAWLGFFLLVGMFLRAVFPPFKKFLIPSCIIGGTVGLIFQSSGLMQMTGIGMDLKVSQLIVYHLFCLTWVYVGLRKPEKKPEMDKKDVSGTKKVLWFLGVYGVSNYGAIGFAVLTTTVLAAIGLNSGPEVIGAINAYGFAGGPGPALSIANVWAMATDFTGLPDFALAGGAMGFAVSIIVGVVLLNIIARKKKIDLVACPSEEEQCGFYECSDDLDDAGKQTTSSTSIDVLAWHIAIGLFTYFLTFTIATVLVLFVLPPAGILIAWSMLFMFCSLVAIGVRTVLAKLNLDHLLCNGMTTRISSTVIDFMICGTFISISIGNISQYMIPYFASVIVLIAFTTAIVWFYTSKLETDGPQAFAMMFGQMTGTISTGLILLRLVDPEGKSSVPIYVALSASLNLPGTFIMPLLLNMVYMYGYSAWAMIASAFGLAMINAVITFICRQPTTATSWEPDPK